MTMERETKIRDFTVSTKRWQWVGISLALVFLSFASYWFAAIAWNIIQDGTSSFLGLFLNWDSGWYLRIVQNGYMKTPQFNGEASWPFFPLYPFLIWIVQNLPFLDGAVAGVILSNAFLFGTLYYVGKYVSLTRNKSAVIPAVVLVAFGPYSFYFSTLYTEPLYMFLLIVGFIQIENENWLYCGLIGALLSATRVTGVLLALPLFVKIIRKSYSKNPNLLNVASELLFDGKKVLSLLLIPLGMASYMVFLYIHVGDALAFSRALTAYNKTLGNPLLVLVDGLLGNGVFGGYRSIYLALWGVFGVAGSVFLLLENRLEEGVFALATVLLATAPGLQSVPRYVVGSLILIITFSDIINYTGRYKWPLIAFLSASNIVLLFLWYTGLPIMV